MEALRELINNFKPKFDKGKKLERFKFLFDAIEAFFFVPNSETTKGSHIRDVVDLKRTMGIVVLALIPLFLFGIWNVGYQYYLSIGHLNEDFVYQFGFGFYKVFPMLLVSYFSGYIVEVLYAKIVKRDVSKGLFVTSLLLTMLMPINIPLWLVAVSMAFTILIKEFYGGTGKNMFNPTALAFCFIFFNFPNQMSSSSWVCLPGEGKLITDGFVNTTPLFSAVSGNFQNLPSFFDLFFGMTPGSVGESSKFLILIGATILIFTGIGSWRIIFSALFGGILMSILFNFIAATVLMRVDVFTQLLLGNFLFGVVFMSVDPVTASKTNIGKFIYGFLFGLLAITIRILLPLEVDGMVFSLLISNILVLAIDYLVVYYNIKKRINRIYH
ncbi:MAG: RnfABCDGE type electron transport complex subunit D [Bacteroidota bacterium]